MSPMRATYQRRCEAGTKGGNPELDRESRRAKLDMDRNTNSRLNRRHFLQAYSSFTACPKMGMDREQGKWCSCLGHLRKIPAESEILHPASNGNQERGNPAKALKVPTLSRRYVASLGAGRIASEAKALGKAKG